MSRRPPTIAIVGGGCSGALVAAQLLRNSTGPLRILLIEQNPPAGLGIAYGTTERRHLLNVVAGNMSAFPAEPDHFVRWVALHEYPA
ncbi:MAG: FAD/NAD(P)-binding protein, partial [Cyanobacteria bacterium REEB65]|nr:FAD/NAD(P)-binding protein [Cyanobacteria bacterium REEB65]